MEKIEYEGRRRIDGIKELLNVAPKYLSDQKKERIPSPGKKWAKREIRNSADKIFNIVAAYTDRELRALLKTAGQFNGINCGWQSYWVAPLLIKISKDLLISRRKIRKNRSK